MQKAFDSVPFATLVDVAKREHFPMVLLRVILGVYAAPRHVVAERGLVGGKAFRLQRHPPRLSHSLL